MHLVWHREHNRLADKLAEVHPDWTDEKLFQEARRINIAQLQNVVYKEYLPAVLGQKVYDLFRLDKPARYDPDLNPTIINSFATAAYRFGHTQINNVYRFGGDNSSVLLQDTFFRPAFYCQKGEESHSQVMESLLKDKAEKVDDKFPEGVTDLLFVGVDSPGVSTDLPARNIQRGRDHGLPPYDEYLDLALSFFNGSIYVSDTKLPSCIDGLYSDTGDVDLFLGAVSEDPVPGGIVGPTFAYLIGLQFQNLREGDRFFFDLKDSAARFTTAQVNSIKATTFSGIICRNSGLHMVQEKAFEIPGVGNPLEICENVPDVDITLW
nr:hypothetical protein BaRGS_011831 [Batillaria attramentaria]